MINFNVISEDDTNEYDEFADKEMSSALSYIQTHLDLLMKQLNFWIEKSDDDVLVEVITKEEILKMLGEGKNASGVDCTDDVLSADIMDNVKDLDGNNEEVISEDVSITDEGYHVCEKTKTPGEKDITYITKETLLSAIEYMDVNCLIDDDHYISYVDLSGNEVEIYDKEKIEKTKHIDVDLEKMVMDTRKILSRPLQKPKRNEEEQGLQKLLTELLVSKDTAPKPPTISIESISDIAELHSMAEIVGRTLETLDQSDATIQMAVHCNKRCIEISQNLLDMQKQGKKIGAHSPEQPVSVYSPTSLTNAVMGCQ